MDSGRDETVGKIVYDILEKEPENAILDPIAMQREAHKNYEKTLYSSIEIGKKAFNGDFYIAVLTIKVPLMRERVLRNKFVHRKTCPTPEYDQTAYRYHRSDDHVEFLWVVPSKATCELLRMNALQVTPEERDLRDFVIEFYDGTLLKQCKKLNNEEDGSNILIIS